MLEKEKVKPTKCLIIAAGRGTRISNKGDSKPLVPLLGLSLIERVILTAKESGLTDFYVVSGYKGEKVRQYLDSFSQERNIKINHVINDEWDKGNGLSVLKAKDLLNENFVLLMSDHIFDKSILRKIRDKGIVDSEVVLAVDRNIETDDAIDVDDVTKVLVRDGKVLNIGKNIKKYNAYDTGIFLCTPAIFNALEESIHNGDDSLSGGINVLAKTGKVKTFDIEGDYWVDVDDEHAFEKAENKLLNTLKKTSDGPVSRYLNRAVSTRITKYLVKTNVTPNIISFISFLLCCMGTFFFFLGGYANLVIGATLAQISSITDGCDGEIARLKFKSTEFGRWFDAVLDRYADAFLLFGLTYYAYSISNDFIIPFIIGFLAIIGSFMNSYTADKYDGLMERELGPKGHYFRIGRDVRIFIIFIGALINQPLSILVLIALLMNIENIRRVVILHKNRE
ncbi:MAG: CDP-alcohol phosphatidyltransferase family protein [Candidatus Thermoplasmatota archaeon]|nr:CDP-alcohol phosphatidyltransferase family protein [Candidatus Thermoplasmatota archaeon]